MSNKSIWTNTERGVSTGGDITGTDVGSKRGMDVIVQGGSLAQTPIEEELILLDEPSSTITYVGFAAIGSVTSGAVWKIKRIFESGTLTTISYADGNSNYDNIWDDRAALSFS